MPASLEHFFEPSRFLSATGSTTSATVAFYYSGTSNLAPVFSDRDLTIPATNPISIADGAILPRLFLNPAINYRRRVVFADGSVQDVDPVPVIALGGNDGAAKVGWLLNAVSAVKRTVADVLSDTTSVKTFGAAGDGVTDDTVAIQAALNSGRKNVLFPQGIYKITSSLSVPEDVFLSGYGATIVGTTVTSHVFDFVNGGGIEGCTITGPGNMVYSANSVAILCDGVNNAPAAPVFVNAPRITNVTINGFGAYGVFLAYVNNPKVTGCVIKNIGYAGIGGVSCNDGLFRGNTIEGVTPGTSGGDAYGIFVDRKNGTSETSDPRSYRCVISENIIKNVSVVLGNNGQGIDTHAGVDFIISNNVVSQCEVGIFVTASVISGVQALAPKNVTVVGNVVSSTLKTGYGIQVAGAENAGVVAEYAENVVVSGNTVVGHGIAADSTSGAVRVQTSRNCSITSNIIRQSVCNGVLINQNNVGLLVSSNSIADPFDNSYGGPACVSVLGSSNSAHIVGNSFIYSTPALGVHVAVNSIRIASGQTNLDISIGRNNCVGIDATHLTYSSGALTGVNTDGFYTERGTAQISCVSGQANNSIVVAFTKRFPDAPSVIDLTITGAIAPGGKTPVLRTSAVTTTGFTIIAYPYDLTAWSSSANLDLSWRASV